MSEALLDVNLLIASVVENHEHHARAHLYLTTVDRFYTTPTTQGGFLRFLTRPWKDQQRREQPPRMTIAQAITALRALTETEKHLFLPDDQPFASVSLHSLSGHRQWTDAYLMALARKHRIKLATFDDKLANMEVTSHPVLQKVP